MNRINPRRFLALCLPALLSPAAGAGIHIPLPPFTVYGEVEHWNGRAYGTADEVTVVVKHNGEVLDRCRVAAGAFKGINFRLLVPLASTRRSRHAMIGDPLTFEIYHDGSTSELLPSATVFAGNPATAQRIELYAGTDSDHDGLPDEYEELLSSYYAMAGLPSGLDDISPDDDFDGDGFTNIQEFEAGTIPVLRSDHLKIENFYQVSDGVFAVDFLSAPGRTYGLLQSTDLAPGSWRYADLLTEPDSPASSPFYFTENDAFTTLYLLSDEAVRAFFTLEVQ